MAAVCACASLAGLTGAELLPRCNRCKLRNATVCLLRGAMHERCLPAGHQHSGRRLLATTNICNANQPVKAVVTTAASAGVLCSAMHVLCTPFATKHHEKSRYQRLMLALRDKFTELELNSVTVTPQSASGNLKHASLRDALPDFLMGQYMTASALCLCTAGQWRRTADSSLMIGIMPTIGTSMQDT
jgi:hypothetical protein